VRASCGGAGRTSSPEAPSFLLRANREKTRQMIHLVPLVPDTPMPFGEFEEGQLYTSGRRGRSSSGLIAFVPLMGVTNVYQSSSRCEKNETVH
jgi:hypothetical protein